MVPPILTCELIYWQRLQVLRFLHLVKTQGGRLNLPVILALLGMYQLAETPRSPYVLYLGQLWFAAKKNQAAASHMMVFLRRIYKLAFMYFYDQEDYGNDHPCLDVRV